MRFKHLALALILLASHITQAAPTPAPIFVRVALTAPAERAWRVHVIAQTPGGKSHALYVAKTVAEAAKGVEWLPAAQASGWIDLSDPKATSGMTVRFLFETQPALATAGVEARIDVADAANDDAILRTITEHDPGNVIAVRIPANPAADKPHILSIRQDTQRRLDEIKSWNLPDGPRPQKIWCMTGFRSNGEFYTDPAIAQMDFEIIRRLGMNGFWQQDGGQPGDLREMAKANGMNRSTVYWRSVESPPRDKELGGTVRLKWDALDDYLDKSYRQSIQGTRKQHPNGMPDEIIADLMDEPAGLPLGGPEYAAEFRQYAERQGQTPATFGKTAWGDVAPIELGWRISSPSATRSTWPTSPPAACSTGRRSSGTTAPPASTPAPPARSSSTRPAQSARASTSAPPGSTTTARSRAASTRSSSAACAPSRSASTKTGSARATRASRWRSTRS